MDSRDLCDHDICVCGESYINIYGYWVTAVPHPGEWQDYFNTEIVIPE